jgi:hypothetical protein
VVQWQNQGSRSMVLRWDQSRVDTIAPFPPSGLHRRFGGRQRRQYKSCSFMLLLGGNHSHNHSIQCREREASFYTGRHQCPFYFSSESCGSHPSLSLPPTHPHPHVSVKVNMEKFHLSVQPAWLPMFIQVKRVRQVGETLACTLFSPMMHVMSSYMQFGWLAGCCAQCSHWFPVTEKKTIFSLPSTSNKKWG